MDLKAIESCIKNVDDGACDKACKVNKNVSKIHPYFATIKPGIVSCIVNHLDQDDGIILDPFCGSGTVGIESAANGKKVICSDLNPLASIIARAKSTIPDVNAIPGQLDEIARTFRSLDDAPVPDVVNREHWFSDTSTRDLARLKASIESVDKTGNEDMLNAVFSTTVKKASNGVNNFYLEYRKPKFGKVKKPIDVLDTYIKGVHDAIVHAPSESFSKVMKVITSDAKNLPLKDESVDVIITDPPYGSAIDYIHAFKMHINWMGLGDHLDMKGKQLGNRTSPRSRCLKYVPKHGEVKNILAKFPFKSGRRRDEVYYCDYANYFDDVEKALVEMNRVVKRGGKMLMRLGNNTAGFGTKTVEIPTTDAVIEIAGTTGWNLVDSFYRDIDNVNGSAIGMYRWKEGMRRERYMLFEKARSP